MSVLQQMKDILSPIGIYSLEDSSLVVCELKAYALQLEKIHEKLSVLLRECFVSTAQDFGIEKIEELFGQARPDLTIQERKAKISKYLTLNNTDFSYENIKNQLKLAGINDSFLQDNENEALSFPEIISESDITEKARRLNIIKDIVPAHLFIDVGITAMCWDELETLNLNFGVFDKMSLRFDLSNE